MYEKGAKRQIIISTFDYCITRFHLPLQVHCVKKPQLTLMLSVSADSSTTCNLILTQNPACMSNSKRFCSFMFWWISSLFPSY